MKKNVIYALAIFYNSKIAPKELGFATQRYFRDAFKSIMEKAQLIDKDRQVISDSTMTEDEKKAELERLSGEEYDVKLNLDLNILDANDIRVTAQELTLLESSLPTKKGVKEVKKK